MDPNNEIIQCSPSPALSESSKYSDVSMVSSSSDTGAACKASPPCSRKVKGNTESNITLWQFLLELLVSNKHQDKIQWTNNDGEFKLVNAEEVAKLWGLRKNKTNMNYDKLSRALRYYYDKNIIKKVMGQKFVYKFVSFPEVVKTENKIPFKVKMESMYSQFGQQVAPSYSVLPPSRPFEMTSVGNTSSDIAPPTYSWPSAHPISHFHLPMTSSLVIPRDHNIPVSSSPGTHTSPYHSMKREMDSLMPAPSSTPPKRPRSGEPVPPHTSEEVKVRSTSSMTVSRPKPLPGPLSLNVSGAPTILSSATPVPLPSPIAKPLQTPFPTLQTPVLLAASPVMGGQRTPFLTFWSSLSPMALSPCFSTASSAFQFPSYVSGHMTMPTMTQVPAYSAYSTYDNLTSPVLLGSPTKIPVL